MDVKLFEKYLNLFIQLYKDNQLIVDWRDNRANFKMRKKPETLISGIESNANEEEFIKSVFTIIDITKSLASSSEDSIEWDSEIVDLVKNVILSDENIWGEITAKVLCQNEYIDDIKYEILTKRSIDNPNCILSYSIQLSLDIKGQNDESTDRIIVELTKDELINFKNLLEDIIQKLESIH
ncbi:hypothetical protein [Calidifontibacillus erzurumensis]|uniref:Uncharacterized protein n=1 Tax=Calidifontibacillus erzurumensis TaxID=2741433 RepID=A0A8J8GGB2_9BACI|nr:hypothetical protein [Calidifontibacillus erzurumensis]NSL52964.1 hypothetical protein [Calidifontibacillus erzurumensis]